MTNKTPVSQDQPLARVRRVRDSVESQRHENELLKQQLAREQRETKATGRLTVGKDMNRLQDQADMYAGRIEQERERIAGERDGGVGCAGERGRGREDGTNETQKD